MTWYETNNLLFAQKKKQTHTHKRSLIADYFLFITNLGK